MKYKCERCPQIRFNRHDDLLDHLWGQHKIGQQPTCDTCGKTYAKMRGLRRHIKVHFFPFSLRNNYGPFFKNFLQCCLFQEKHLNQFTHHCPVKGCDFKVESKGKLDKHIEVKHPKNPKWQCKECKKTLATQEILVHHLASYLFLGISSFFFDFTQIFGVFFFFRPGDPAAH